MVSKSKSLFSLKDLFCCLLTSLADCCISATREEKNVTKIIIFIESILQTYFTKLLKHTYFRETIPYRSNKFYIYLVGELQNASQNRHLHCSQLHRLPGQH